MTVYVIQDGVFRIKPEREADFFDPMEVRFPCPRISRMEPYESPVTGKEISSWSERDKDMRAVDAVDLRDYPKDHKFSRGRDVQLKETEL